MKLIHLSDLHLGKRLCGYSLLADQAFILEQILAVIDDEHPDAVLIAGDVFDKTVPPAEAVQLFDEFLTRLSRRGLETLIVSGNHDSPERLAFGARLMDPSGVHIAPVFNGALTPLKLRDAYGEVNFWLLPFLKPAVVRPFFPDRTLESSTDAVRAALEGTAPDERARNVLVAHQFVTGAACCDSEERSVGGSDNVDGALFDAFDYVALGHLHTPQCVGRETLRYCGSPLKYSFSEAGHGKSVTVVELAEKGRVTVRTIPLSPLRELREIRGSYNEVTLRSFYAGTDLQDSYLHITLTDEEDIPDAVGRLRAVYPNIMKLDYDNARTRAPGALAAAGPDMQETPLALFEIFYEKQNARPMTAEQRALVAGLIERIWGAAL